MTGLRNELGDPGKLQADVKEDDNNKIRAEELYNFTDDDGEVDFDHSSKQLDKDDADEEMFLKIPLKTQTRCIRKNLKTMQYQCPYCSFASLYYSAVSNHTLIHTGEKPYHCHLCNYQARQQGHMILHMRIHSGKKPFKCKNCSYSTTQQNHLRVHKRVHEEDVSFQCPGCDYQAKHLNMLQIHMRKNKHGRSFSCNQCDYTALRKNNLAQHMRVHSGAKPFKCDMCPYRSSQKGHLNVHIRTHTREKPYKCHKCPFASTVPKTLREHITMHQGKRPHKCPHCTFSTNQSFCLKKHVALHVNKNASFRCSHCSFTSSIQEDFVKHCTIHTVPSSYVCNLCDFTTPFKYQYTTHIMNHDQASKTNSSDVTHGSPFKANGKEKHDSFFNISSSCDKSLKKSDINHKDASISAQNRTMNSKTKSKLRICTNSLVAASKECSTPAQSTDLLNIDQVSPSVSHSTALETQENSSVTKAPQKKAKKAFVCLYCDLNLPSRDDWVAHEMRHFKTWPEII